MLRDNYFNAATSAATAAGYLGISIRQSHRYASGDQPVAEPVALLLAMYLKHGLPE